MQGSFAEDVGLFCKRYRIDIPISCLASSLRNRKLLLGSLATNLGSFAEDVRLFCRRHWRDMPTQCTDPTTPKTLTLYTMDSAPTLNTKCTHPIHTQDTHPMHNVHTQSAPTLHKTTLYTQSAPTLHKTTLYTPTQPPYAEIRPFRVELLPCTNAHTRVILFHSLAEDTGCRALLRQM